MATKRKVYVPIDSDGWHYMAEKSYNNFVDALMDKGGKTLDFTGLRVHEADGPLSTPTNDFPVGYKYNPQSMPKLDVKIVDDDKDFTGAYIAFDRNATKGETIVKFMFDKKAGAFVATVDGQKEYIHAAVKGDTLTAVLDVAALAHIIDNDGNLRNGVQAFDGTGEISVQVYNGSIDAYVTMSIDADMFGIA